MTGLKYIAAMLALVGAVGSVQAASEMNKDQVQFMDNKGLSEIQGTRSGANLGNQSYKGKYKLVCSRTTNAQKQPIILN